MEKNFKNILELLRLLRINSRLKQLSLSRLLRCDLRFIYDSLEKIIDDYSAEYISIIDFSKLGLFRFIIIIYLKHDHDNEGLIDGLVDSNFVNSLSLSESAVIADAVFPDDEMMKSLLHYISSYDIIGLHLYPVIDVLCTENFSI